jgi:hypothetical protein
VSYCESDLPGGRLLRELWWTVNPPLMITVRGVSGDGRRRVEYETELFQSLGPRRTEVLEMLSVIDKPSE